jgi:UDP-N-acetylmuramate dehydrogenase
MQRRRAGQPLEYPSAGSVFKRPEGHFAGALIEQSGLKGCRIGGAMVSPKHAGFIVNVGGATARDVLQLIGHIQTVVERDHGILLEPEVQILTALHARNE